MGKQKDDSAKSHKSSTTGAQRGAADDLDVFGHLCRVLDRKHLADLFFDVRRWQLLPPWRPCVAKDDDDSESVSPTGPNARATSPRTDESRSSTGSGDPSFDDVDADFELFRLQHVAESLTKFEEAAKLFTDLHGKTPFLDTLNEYLNPMPEHDGGAESSDSSASSLASVSEFF